MTTQSFITFLVAGAIVGWVASYLVRGRGFGILGNILVGMVGSVLGGFGAELAGFNVEGMTKSIIVAAVGAAALISAIAFIRSR